MDRRTNIGAASPELASASGATITYSSSFNPRNNNAVVMTTTAQYLETPIRAVSAMLRESLSGGVETVWVPDSFKATGRHTRTNAPGDGVGDHAVGLACERQARSRM